MATMETLELRQNSILRISDDKTMELVNLYEKEECLWNSALEVYKNRHTRNQAAERIASKLDIPHFSSRYVVIKFKNLRNSYCQELKKIASSAQAGDDPVYKPKVFWFKKMDSFLRPHVQSSTRERNYTVDVDFNLPLSGYPATILDCIFSYHHKTRKISVKEEPAESEEMVQFSNPEDVFVEESHLYSDSEDFDEEELVQKRSRNSSTTSKRPRLDDTSESDLPRLMRDISSQLRVMGRDRDHYDSFGKYVSAMLRNMPPQRALEVQPQLVSLLVAATLGSEDKETIT